MKRFKGYLMLSLIVSSCGGANMPVPTNHCVTYTSNGKTYVSCTDGSLTEVGPTDGEDLDENIKAAIGKVNRDACKNKGFSVVVFKDINDNNVVDHEEEIVDTLVICHKKHEHNHHRGHDREHH